jgi:hypothetical protein
MLWVSAVQAQAPQLINGNRTLAGWLNAVTTAGTPNTYTATLDKLTQYRPQMCVVATIHAPNTGAATLNINAKGALPIQKWQNGSLVDLALGDLSAGQMIELCYDTTRWQVLSLGAGLTTVAWGDIGGTLADQLDLQAALDAKQDALGFTAVPETRTLDINGTANEIEVDQAGPLDLTGNRAWQVGIPSNAQLSVAKLLNLTSNGVVVTSGSDGTLGVSSQSLTQSGLIWNVAPATCGLDPNGGKLTLAGAEIVCSADVGGTEGGSTAFSALGAGTNTTAAMLVGSGASLGHTGTGTVTANRLTSTGVGLVAVDTSSVPTLATANEVIALFASGTCSGYLKSDGTCDTPPGGGTVGVSGTPTLGQAAEWVNATTIQGVAVSGTGNYVKATSPVLTTPNLGTPSALVLTNATGLPTTGLLDNAVTYGKLQDVTAASRLLGRGSAAGAGDPQELTLGTWLSLTGTMLTLGGTLADLNTAVSDANLLPDPGSNGLVNRTGATSTSAVTSNTVGAVLRVEGANVVGFGQVNLADGDAITGDLPYGNLTPATAATRFLCRGSEGGPGDWQECTFSTGLSLSGTALAATASGSALTVRESDGSPSVATVTTIQVSPGTLVDNTGGTVTLTTGGGGRFGLNVLDYGATNDDLTDDTTAIQAALNAASGQTGAATVFLPGGDYYVSQLSIPQGVSLVGAGPGMQPNAGTRLWQIDGVNVSAIVGGACTATTNYWHWSKIRDLAIRKVGGSADTLGSAIEVACRSGESLLFQHLLLQDFPQHGLWLRHGGVPVMITDVHPFGNQGYGINLERTAGDVWNMVTLQGISGDSNTLALLRISGGGAAMETFHVQDVKAEATGSAPVRQPVVILLDGVGGAPVSIENISATVSGGATITDLIKVQGTGSARVFLTNSRCNGCTNLLTDTLVPVSYAYTLIQQYWVAYQFGTLQRFSTSGIGAKALAVGDDLAASATAGVYTQQAGADAVTLQTLTRFTDTTPTGAFQTFQTAAAAPLWTVDITGTLTTGTIPVPRLTGTLADLNAAITDAALAAKGGTPVATQIGIWTGPDTVAGFPSLTFNDTTRVLTLGTPAVTSGSLRLVNDHASGNGVTLSADAGDLGPSAITVPGLTGRLGVTGTLVDGKCIEAQSGKLVTTANACNTYTDVRLPPRTVALSINAGHGALVGPATADYIVHDALPSGTIIDCPSGASVENESITFRFLTASSVPFSWDAGCYVETAHLTRPTQTSGNNTYDILKFIRAPTPDTWILVAKVTETSGEVGTTFGIKEASGGPSIVDNLVVPDGTLSVVGDTATLAFPTFTGAETLTNKRITSRVAVDDTAASVTPNCALYDQYVYTALAEALIIAAPSCPSAPPTDGQVLLLTIKDDGTSRGLTWTGGAGGFVKEHAVQFPTSTPVGEWISLQVRYNASTTHWSAVGSTVGVEPLTNPMTTAGDFIVGGASGVPTRVAGGTLPSPLRLTTLTDGSPVNVVQLAVASNTGSSVRIDYAIEVLTGTNEVQIESGFVICHLVNQAGSLGENTCTETSTQSLGTGTLTSAWALSAANPSQITVLADTSLSPSAGYPKLRYSALSLGGQALTLQ